MKSKATGHIATAAAYAIFGLNIIFCKDIADSDVISPIALFSVRAIGAAVLFWLISLFVPREKVPPADLLRIAAASFIGFFITQYTFLEGMTMVTTIDAAVLGTLGPIFTMIFAFFFLKEPITFKKASGVALSFAGVLFLIFNSVHSGGASSSTVGGILLLLFNSLSFALYLALFRPLIERYSVITFMKWIFLFALLMSLPFSAKGLLAVDFASIPSSLALEIGYLVFFATFVAYFLIPIGQKHLRPTLVSLYAYLQPVIAAAVSIAYGLDTLSWQKIVATILIVVGVILVSFSRAASSASASTSGGDLRV
ncbi:MAG: EamA family transporter [Bacteroidales bacterium]|nr:EamA family transporter [Bacteroidales bacterium]